MSDKIKRAARKRMAETGEPYTLARRKVTGEHQAPEVPAQETAPWSRPDADIAGDLREAMRDAEREAEGPFR